MLGIYGGTFDPVHNGHLRAALEVKQLLSLDEVRFVPSAVPPHRVRPDVSAEQRLQLLQMAIAGTDGFTADRRELDRQGPSYMVDTLQSFRHDFPGLPICLIMGVDAFLGLPAWHQWQDLLSYAHLVVTNRMEQRPEVSEDLSEVIARALCSHPEALSQSLNGQVYFCRVSSLEISATLIREELRHGKSAKYWMPDVVCDEIQRQGLYAP